MNVSAIIPFYNRSELLRYSITSVLDQTRPAHEIIVVDDCSPQNIDWVASTFPTVRIIRTPHQMGPGGARYFGAQTSTGTHIATLDLDDYWYTTKLEKQVAFAEKIGDSRGVYSHLQWVVEDGGASLRPRTLPQPNQPLSEYLFVQNEQIQTNTFLVEKELYLQLSRTEDGSYSEDTEIVLEAERRQCSIYILEESLGQWNCTSDPGRCSQLFHEDHYREFVNRQAVHLTPKARAAFLGRILAPSLAQHGKMGEAAHLLANASFIGALQPREALKIFLRLIFPKSYVWGASSYNRLLGRKREHTA